MSDFAQNVDDVPIRQILAKIDATGKRQVLEDLELIEVESLDQVRSQLFHHAEARFRKLIDDKSLPQPDLSLKKRTLKNKGCNQLLAKDIYDLFIFCAELGNIFPKDVLTNTAAGRYLDISTAKDDPALTDKPPSCNGASHIMMINRVQELQDKNDKQEEQLRELKGRVETMESAMKDMKGHLTTLLGLAAANGLTTESTVEGVGNSGSNIVVENADAKASDTMKQHDAMSPTSALKHAVVTALSTEQSSRTGGDPQLDINTPQTSASSNAEKSQQDKHDESGEETISFVFKGGENEARKQYSEALLTEGPFHIPKYHQKKAQKPGRDGMQISLTNKGKTSVRNVHTVKNIGTSRLTGAKRENSIVMYLSGVETDDMTDEDLSKAVKEHARLVNMRVMTADVIHNRYCDYIVGVKIRIPESQESLALEFDTWPDDIKCRRWEKRTYRSNTSGSGY